MGVNTVVWLVMWMVGGAAVSMMIEAYVEFNGPHKFKISNIRVLQCAMFPPLALFFGARWIARRLFVK